MNASNVAHERTRPVALRTNRARVLVAAPVAPPPTPDVAIGAPPLSPGPPATPLPVAGPALTGRMQYAPTLPPAPLSHGPARSGLSMWQPIGAQPRADRGLLSTSRPDEPLTPRSACDRRSCGRRSRSRRPG